MLTPEQKAILENAADLLEESGHAGAYVLRKLIRDKRLEVLVTFLLYGGYLGCIRSQAGGLALEFDYGEDQTRHEVTLDELRFEGFEPVVAGIIKQIDNLEAHAGQRICERGETPLVDCLDTLERTLGHQCPGCQARVALEFDPLTLRMTCNACGYQMQVPPHGQ
jgi:hypothetical protein